MIKGLLIKDILVLKKNLCIALFLFIFFAVIGRTAKDISFFSLYIMLLFGLTNMGIYGYDEQARWEPYAIATLSTRKQLIQSRFILTILLNIIGYVSSLLIQIPNLLANHRNLTDLTPVINLYGLSMALLINFLIIPIVIKTGIERGRIILLILVAIPTIIVVFNPSKLLSHINTEFIKSIQNYLPCICVLFTLIFGLISYAISLRLELKKQY